ncbi:MAG: CapA family protein [candidate division WOR-3 bacterium]
MIVFALLSARLLLVATGDALMHQPVQSCASDSGYDFLYEKVAPIIRWADIGFVNVEFPVAPKTGKPPRPFVFNAKPEALSALARAGFTVFNLANNHMFDQGPLGLSETCFYMDSLGLGFVGAGRSAQEARRGLVMDKSGIRVAFLAYTTILNISGNSENPNKPRVNIFDMAAAKDDLSRLRDTVDFIVLSLHWGAEYVNEPTSQQRATAHALCEAGADVVLGHHPHVLGPVEEYRASDGRRCVIAYSLGNFISNQERNYTLSMPPEKGDPRDGVLLYLAFVEDSSGRRMEGPWAVPLWTENRGGIIRSWPMEMFRPHDPKLIEIRWRRVWEVLGLPER